MFNSPAMIAPGFAVSAFLPAELPLCRLLAGIDDGIVGDPTPHWFDPRVVLMLSWWCWSYRTVLKYTWCVGLVDQWLDHCHCRSYHKRGAGKSIEVRNIYTLWVSPSHRAFRETKTWLNMQSLSLRLDIPMQNHLQTCVAVTLALLSCQRMGKGGAQFLSR